MRGIHFVTRGGIEFIGLDDATKAAYCADVALPGDLVTLAEDVDPEASMRMLSPEQQRLVEYKTPSISEVWLTIDTTVGSGVLWCQYAFKGIVGKYRGDAFVDASFEAYATGALIPVADALWFVPVVSNLRRPPWTFGEPILIDGLGRSARHRLLGTFVLGEDTGAQYADMLRAANIEPVWGKATLTQKGEGIGLLAMEIWECGDPRAIPDLIYAIEQSGVSPTR